MFKELVKERDKAKKEYDKICKTVKPYWDRFMETEDAIEKAFIEQKLYIPIDKLKDYLKEKEAESFTIVYENGETEHLNHSYGIDYKNTKWSKGKYVPGNMIVSSCDDTGYSFSYDIDEEHIVGFYDLTYEYGKKVKETCMEEIIKNLE